MGGSASEGPRVAELFLAELVGRDLGPLARIGVTGLDHPARFGCAVGETYTLTIDGRPRAMVLVDAEGVEIRFADERAMRFEAGETVKPALDELVRGLT